MSDSEWPVSRDPVKQIIERANLAFGGRDVPAQEVLDELEALGPRDLVRFDERSRAFYSGLRPGANPSPGAVLLWRVAGLVSRDGHEREQAVRAVPLTRLTARLVTVRCVDWVQQVRDAALARLDTCPPDLLAELLPLAGQLAAERARGALLHELLDARLSDADLRRARGSADPLTRRAGWQRLAARGALDAAELCSAARDPDVLVRAIAARALPELPAEVRRSLAGVLVRDPVGWVAGRALAVLVEQDGVAAIRAALLERSATVRRKAREWAEVRDVDARSVYLERLAGQPGDAVALVALAELGAAQDAGRFCAMLDDPRARVRAAGLRALARVDREAGRRAAIAALERRSGGRVARAATDVLRDGVPTREEAAVLARVVLDPATSPGRRSGVLALLRPLRWLQLAVLLEVRAATREPTARRRLDHELSEWIRLSRGLARPPEAGLRARIEEFLPALAPGPRLEIEFALRTAGPS